MTLKYFSKIASAASLQFAGLEQRAGPESASSILADRVFFPMELVILSTVGKTLGVMRQYKNISLLWGHCTQPMLGAAVHSCGAPLPFLPPEDVNLCCDLKACVPAGIAHTSCPLVFFGGLNPRLQPCALERNMRNAEQCSAWSASCNEGQ